MKKLNFYNPDLFRKRTNSLNKEQKETTISLYDLPKDDRNITIQNFNSSRNVKFTSNSINLPPINMNMYNKTISHRQEQTEKDFYNPLDTCKFYFLI